jgi:hypothetical protein
VTLGLPLPTCEPGGPDAALVTAEITEWVTSPALEALVVQFGGTVPSGPLPALLDALAGFSATVWDFRAGRFERYDIERINYEPEVDTRVRAAIHALGLGGDERPRHGAYDHVLILGGGIRVALARTAYAGRLLDRGVKAGSVAALGGLRPRNDLERAEAARLGLDGIETEADMMDVGLRLALGLGVPSGFRSGDGWWVRTYDDDVHVIAAPSTRPGMRANTADTLIGWARHVGAPDPSHRVLVVTNDPYVRLQHCDAMRLLGLEFGCGVETVRLDAAATATWVRTLSTTELLQEVRSSILAMRHLYSALA